MSSITLLLDESDAVNAEHWETVARAAAPRVDVTRAGVMRAAITYALWVADSMATRGGVARARSYLMMGPWHPGVSAEPEGRAHLSPVKLILPGDLLVKLQVRGRELLAPTKGGLRAVTAVFLHLGLHELHGESPGEVAEFLRQHFEGEAGSGLRRGRPRRAAA